MGEIEDLPRSEFGFPGPLRDKLVAAIMTGEKTATTSTLVEYGIDDEPLPLIGAQYAVVDSADEPVAIVEVTDVQQVRLADVPWGHARDEGEGYSSLAEWRDAHENYWHSDDMRDFLRSPEFTVNDDTMVVLERFRLIRSLSAAREPKRS